MSGEWSGHVGPILTSHVIWVLLPLIAGFARTTRREVS